MDCYDHCDDKNHFVNYPHEIDYVYNSRGFRDSEWPDSIDELKDCIWCIGDSFTVGVGQPYQHTWPQVLSHQTGVRTINVSMDGASNDWIFRKVTSIMGIIEPTHLVLMWSYTHRRESADPNQSDENRRISYSKDTVDQDIDHWQSLAQQTKTLYPSVVQSSIPQFMPYDHQNVQRTWNAIKDDTWPSCPKTLADLKNLPAHICAELQDLHNCYIDIERALSKILPEYVIYINHQLDYARDHHHFDILTSHWVVKKMMHYLHG